MNKMRIEKEEYEKWATDKAVDYASTTVKGPGGLAYRLVFYVLLSGTYRVTRGLDALYEGPSFSAAAAAFNEAA